MTGKFNRDTIFPKDDWRSTWDLRSEWSTQRNPRTIPIPGFKTVAQVQENIQALDFGLLSREQMQKIDEVFERAPVIP